MTPAGTSNELDVRNEREENTTIDVLKHKYRTDATACRVFKNKMVVVEFNHVVMIEEHTLTVDHLYDTVRAGDTGGELVPSRYHVAGEGSRQDRLVGFPRPTGGINEVSSWEMGIDRRRVSIVFRAI